MGHIMPSFEKISEKVKICDKLMNILKEMVMFLKNRQVTYIGLISKKKINVKSKNTLLKF